LPIRPTVRHRPTVGGKVRNPPEADIWAASNAANQPREVRASDEFASLCSLFPLFRVTATVHHRNDND
jgi:hypothetical protein